MSHAEFDNLKIKFEDKNKLWTLEESKFIFEKYKEYIDNVGRHVHISNINHLWKEITVQLNNTFHCARTADECNLHCSQLLMTLLNSDSNDEMDSITQILNNHPSQQLDKKCVVFIIDSLRHTLLEIAQIKERNNERRHKELMELLEKHLTHETKPHRGCITSLKNKAIPKLLPNQKTKAEQGKYNNKYFHSVVPGSNLNNLSKIVTPTIAEYQIRDIKPKLSVLNGLEIKHRANTSTSTIVTPTVGVDVTARSTNEFQMMRNKMLQKQREKMRDREKKKLKFIKQSI